MSTMVSAVIESRNSSPSGNAHQWNICSVSPSTSNIRNTLGPSWMPAPISLNSGACSSTCTGMPLRDSASAADNPPMPPPTTRTGLDWRSHSYRHSRTFRHRLTLEHDAETWEALPGRNADMKKPTVAWLALGLLGVAAPASAQTFPSKTITIVSPAPAGGVTDIIGRALAQRFNKAWGAAGGGREQARRQQPDRRRIHRQFAARRPHPVHRAGRHLRRQSEPLSPSCPTIRTRASRRSRA